MGRYSDQEKRLFSMFGFFNTEDFDEVPLYKICVDNVFINNLHGPHVEALRRGYRAIVLCTAYRLTPEFERLIKF